MIAFLIEILLTILTRVADFFTKGALTRFFDSKKKTEPTDQIDALIAIHKESLENAVKRKELELELAEEKKDKKRIQAELNELKNRLSNPEKALQEAHERIASLESALEREGNEIGAEKLTEAKTAIENGDFSKAEELFAEIETREKLAVERAARAAFARGEIANQEVRLADAAEHYARAAQLGPCFKTLIMAERFAHVMGNYDSALSFGLEAQKAAIAEHGEESKEYANSLNNVALNYETQGRLKEAGELYKQALKICKNIFKEPHFIIAISLNNIGNNYQLQEKYDKAEKFHKQGLQMRKEVLDEGHPEIANSQHNLAGIYRRLGQYEEAEKLYMQALINFINFYGKTHYMNAICFHNLSILYENQRQYEKALPLSRQAVEIAETTLGPDHPNTKVIRDDYEFLKILKANAENDASQ